MLEQILDRVKSRVDAAEVYGVTSEDMAVSFEAGMLKNIERTRFTGAGLRVIKDGRIGFAATTDPDRIDRLVYEAVAGTEFGKMVAYTFPGTFPETTVETFDPDIASFTPERAVEEGRKAVDILAQTVPDGQTEMGIETSQSSVRILNTAGLDASYRTTDFSNMVLSVIVKDDSILWIDEGGHYGSLILKTDEYVAQIAERARQAKTVAPSVNGKLPVIFVAQQMPNVLQAVEMAVDGTRLYKGDSPLIGRVGESVLGSVTLVDDPFVPFGLGSRPFDDEGTPSQSTVLFENGVFRSFLFDLDIAAETGNRSTGSAERGALSLPSTGTSNFVMSPGASSREKMIGSLDRGVIVYGVLGGGQSNLLAGDYAFNVMLGFLVEGGEIVGRLADTMISGNIYDDFARISDMGSTCESVGSYRIPDVMFSDLAISSR